MAYNVAVLGASSNPERYSYKAVEALKAAGHKVFPVHPSAEEVAGIKCYADLKAVPDMPDTISVYLSRENSTPLIEEIIGCRPRRVILNPGAENDNLKRRCESAGIPVQEACTLVLLSTGQF